MFVARIGVDTALDVSLELALLLLGLRRMTAVMMVDVVSAASNLSWSKVDDTHSRSS